MVRAMSRLLVADPVHAARLLAPQASRGLGTVPAWAGAAEGDDAAIACLVRGLGPGQEGGGPWGKAHALEVEAAFAQAVRRLHKPLVMHRGGTLAANLSEAARMLQCLRVLDQQDVAKAVAQRGRLMKSGGTRWSRGLLLDPASLQHTAQRAEAALASAEARRAEVAYLARDDAASGFSTVTALDVVRGAFEGTLPVSAEAAWAEAEAGGKGGPGVAGLGEPGEALFDEGGDCSLAARPWRRCPDDPSWTVEGGGGSFSTREAVAAVEARLAEADALSAQGLRGAAVVAKAELEASGVGLSDAGRCWWGGGGVPPSVARVHGKEHGGLLGARAPFTDRAEQLMRAGQDAERARAAGDRALERGEGEHAALLASRQVLKLAAQREVAWQRTKRDAARDHAACGDEAAGKRGAFGGGHGGVTDGDGLALQALAHDANSLVIGEREREREKESRKEDRLKTQLPRTFSTCAACVLNGRCNLALGSVLLALGASERLGGAGGGEAGAGGAAERDEPGGCRGAPQGASGTPAACRTPEIAAARPEGIVPTCFCDVELLTLYAPVFCTVHRRWLAAWWRPSPCTPTAPRPRQRRPRRARRGPQAATAQGAGQAASRRGRQRVERRRLREPWGPPRGETLLRLRAAAARR